MDDIKIELLKDEVYDQIIGNLNSWFGGRNMTDLLPRLFFTHFKNTSFVARVDEQLAGFIVGFFSPSEKNTGYIHFVCVDPKYRKRGIGRKLYDAFFKLCIHNKIAVVNCVTSPINTNSIAFHLSIGFETSTCENDGHVVPSLNYDGPNNHRVLFQKDIAAMNNPNNQ